MEGTLVGPPTHDMTADGHAASYGSVQLSATAAITLFVFLAALPIVANITFRIFIYPFFFSPLRALPGPKDNLPFVGQCHKLLQATWVPRLFLRWSKQWPGSPFIRYLGLANSEYLVACSNTAYREILQTKNSFFVKPNLTRKCAAPIIGDGLPFAHGQLHRSRRALLMKAFNTSQVKALVPGMRRKAQQLVMVLRNARNGSEEVEVESHVWKAVLDIIGQDIVGSDLNHLGGSLSPLYGLFDRTMRQSTWGHIIHYLNSYLPLRKLMPTSQNSGFVSICEETRTILRTFLDVRRNAMNESTTQEPDDVLQILIGQGNEWSDDEIVEYLLNLFMLGHDTTACTLVWALHVVADQPQYQERLRTEMMEMMDSRPDFTFDDLGCLKFLDSFLREILRVYCPVAYVPREATEDVEIDGVRLPKGTVVNLCPAVLNLQPTLWGDDAAEFNPGRWEAFEQRQLSMTEMKLILVELISSFHIKALNEKGPVELASPSFTLRPKHMLSVQLSDIERKA